MARQKGLGGFEADLPPTTLGHQFPGQTANRKPTTTRIASTGKYLWCLQWPLNWQSSPDSLEARIGRSNSLCLLLDTPHYRSSQGHKEKQEVPIYKCLMVLWVMLIQYARHHYSIDGKWWSILYRHKILSDHNKFIERP